MTLQQVLNKIMGVRFEETVLEDLNKCGFVRTPHQSQQGRYVQYERGNVRVTYDNQRDEVIEWKHEE